MTDSFLAGLLRALPAGTVSTEPADLSACAVDQGPVLDDQMPIAVVRAQSVEDVQTVMRAAHAAGVPVVCRGAGTGVSGGAHATEGCLVLSLERMDRILEIHPEDEIARVEPGVSTPTERRGGRVRADVRTGPGQLPPLHHRREHRH